MKHLFLLLALAACTAPRAEAEISPDSQPQTATNVKPLGDEDLEAQIAKDFEPYLKYLAERNYIPIPSLKMVLYCQIPKKQRILSNLRIAVLF